MVDAALPSVPRSLYARLADRLSDTAERDAQVSIYISPEDIAEALGDKQYDPDVTAYDIAKRYVDKRRMLGFEPTADELLDLLLTEIKNE